MKIVSVLLAVFLFLFSAVFSAFTVARPQNFSKAVAKADMSWLLDEFDIDKQIADTLAEPRFENLGISPGLVDAYSVNSFLRRRGVRDGLGIIIEPYIMAIAEGNLDHQISARDIENFLRAVSDDIYDEFNYRLTSENYALVRETLGRDELKEFRAGKILSEAQVDASVPQTFFSVYPLIIFGILCAMCVAFIVTINRRKITSALLYIGIPLCLSGLLYVFAGLMLGSLSGIFSGGAYKAVRLISGLTGAVLVTGLVVLGVGLLSIGACILIKKLRRSAA